MLEHGTLESWFSLRVAAKNCLLQGYFSRHYGLSELYFLRNDAQLITILRISAAVVPRNILEVVASVCYLR